MAAVSQLCMMTSSYTTSLITQGLQVSVQPDAYVLDEVSEYMISVCAHGTLRIRYDNVRLLRKKIHVISKSGSFKLTRMKE